MKKETFPQNNTKPARESCSTCKYCIDKTCFHDAPQVSVVLVPQQAPMGVQGRGMAMQPVPMSAWPPVDRPDIMWCGQWTPQGSRVVGQLQ